MSLNSFLPFTSLSLPPLSFPFFPSCRLVKTSKKYTLELVDKILHNENHNFPPEGLSNTHSYYTYLDLPTHPECLPHIIRTLSYRDLHSLQTSIRFHLLCSPVAKPLRCSTYITEVYTLHVCFFPHLPLQLEVSHSLYANNHSACL